jgi:LmbE family N-acetylglucosaminyl deacetylase
MGIETGLVMATRGQKGWKLGDHPGAEAVAARRTRELERAAETLGIRHLTVLDHQDGDLDRAPPQVAITEIAEAIRRRRPDVVLTFGLEGAYGHPDHIAISQLTTAAIVKAAGGHEPLAGLDPHQVSKLYHLADTEELIAAYVAAFGAPAMRVNGVLRTFRGWEAWYPSARIDTRAHLGTVRAAILEHRSQLRGYEDLLEVRPRLQPGERRPRGRERPLRRPSSLPEPRRLGRRLNPERGRSS